MSFTIESGIPLPKKKTWSKWNDIPFGDMNSGDSVLLKSSNSTISLSSFKGTYASIQACMRAKGVSKDFKVAVTEDGKQIRLWRK